MLCLIKLSLIFCVCLLFKQHDFIVTIINVSQRLVESTLDQRIFVWCIFNACVALCVVVRRCLFSCLFCKTDAEEIKFWQSGHCLPVVAMVAEVCLLSPPLSILCSFCLFWFIYRCLLLCKTPRGVTICQWTIRKVSFPISTFLHWTPLCCYSIATLARKVLN